MNIKYEIGMNQKCNTYKEESQNEVVGQRLQAERRGDWRSDR